MVGTGSAGGRPLAYVLDDEPAVAKMICKQLTMLGMEAWEYGDPGNFFKAVRVRDRTWWCWIWRSVDRTP